MRASSTFDADLVGYGGHPDRPSRPSAANVFVSTLLVVLGMLFLLLTIAYLARAQLPDWRSLASNPTDPLSVPWRLWFNTALLAAGSAALLLARRAARRGDDAGVRRGFGAAIALGAAFLAGQLWVWNELVAGGHVVSANPANGFFYLITALHGVHVVVGLAVLALVAARLRRRAPRAPAGEGVALAGRYWHFLLVVWLAMFALVASPPASIEAFAALCGLR